MDHVCIWPSSVIDNDVNGIVFINWSVFLPAPEFVKRLAQEITVDEGSTVCFDCKVVAFPNPAITWTKDNESLPSDSRIQTETSDNGGYALKINDVTKKDEAAYRCRAENVEGSSSSTIYLAVKGISILL